MTTSGTYSFSYNRDQIIRAAYRKIGAIRAGEIPSAQMTLDGSDALNAMVKEWEATGIHVWTEREGYLFLQPGQTKYTISSSVVTDQSTQSFFQTTSTTSMVTGATALTLGAASGIPVSGGSTPTVIANGYIIGVMLASGGIYWSTVNSISGINVTLTTGVSGPVNMGAPVYAFQSQIMIKPLRMPFARRLYLIGQEPIYTPMFAMSRKDYYDLPNKNDSGTITQFYYSPRLTVGEVSVWPAPVDSSSMLEFTWLSPIQDFDVAGDTPDLPQEWISTLIFNLAVEMAPEFGVPADIYQMVKAAAAEKLDRLMGWDREPESIQFGVDMSQMGD